MAVSELSLWRQIAVAGILGGLAATLIWQVGDGSTRPASPVSSLAPPASISSAPQPISSGSVVRPPVVSGGLDGANASVRPQTGSTDTKIVRRARAALDAWGWFAISGDVTVLEPWFAEDGPQYRQLSSEADDLRRLNLGEPAYSVTLESPLVTRNGGQPQVSGRVSFARPGEATQIFEWRLTFRESGRGVVLWSVEDP